MSHTIAEENTASPMPGLGVDNLKLGMWVFLLSEVMFFTSLIGAYIILRFATPEAFTEPGVVLNVPLTAVNTFMLICSSVTMVKAFVAIEAGDQRGLVRWLWATIVLGTAFLGIQVIEYIELVNHGFVPSAAAYAAEGGPLYGMTFYTMTGFHGLHVAIGVACLLFTVVKAHRGGYSAGDHAGVEIMGLYWHFVDLVWIILFTIAYLI